MPLGTSIQCAVLLFIALLAGCGRQPAGLFSRLDIMLTPASETMIDIGSLPIEDFPRLAKFRKLWQVDFYNLNVGDADPKIQEFAKLEFDKPINLLLYGSGRVTDKGVASLAQFKLEGIGLDATDITDESLRILAANPWVTGLSIQDCDHITRQGILHLVTTANIEDLGITLEEGNQQDVVELIARAKALKYLSIVDRTATLDSNVLRSIGEQHGMIVLVRTRSHLDEYGQYLVPSG